MDGEPCVLRAVLAAEVVPLLLPAPPTRLRKLPKPTRDCGSRLPCRLEGVEEAETTAAYVSGTPFDLPVAVEGCVRQQLVVL